MSSEPEELAAEAPRALQIAVGLVASAVAALIALVVIVNAREWWLVPASRELSPPAAAIVSSGAAVFGWFWCVIAYRLLRHRPNREGGLFSRHSLYGAAVITLVGSLAMLLAPGVPLDGRLRALLSGLPMSAACWLVARRRRAARVGGAS